MAASAGTVAGASRSDAVSLAVIARTIIPGVADPARLARFYDEAYSQEADDARLYARWRALGARGKADHVIALCARAGISPASTLEVGCGDGALLCELHCRSFGGRLSGVEISAAAVALARARREIETVALYDGRRLPLPAGDQDLGILSHVLEHVPEPAVLLAEVARVCRAVLVEVPLEANLSAARAGKREHSAEVGHLQRLDRAAARRIVAEAGLTIASELDDPLPLAVHTFFATTPSARMRARAKWALRSALHRLAPSLARRLFTVHYASLCLPVAWQLRTAATGSCPSARRERRAGQ
jgi:SAM-dependent methyltransferase